MQLFLAQFLFLLPDILSSLTISQLKLFLLLIIRLLLAVISKDLLLLLLELFSGLQLSIHELLLFEG